MIVLDLCGHLTIIINQDRITKQALGAKQLDLVGVSGLIWENNLI